MASIEAVGAREILDSRGNPTVEVEVALDDGTIARAAVPSGASTGAFEAVERRDGDKARYLGKGVEEAVNAVIDEIAPELIGFEADRAAPHRRRADRPRRHRQQGQARRQRDPRRLARRRQGRRRLGRTCRCSATSAARTRTCCPVPMMNILNGGSHADSNVDIQEFMVAPIGATTFREALRTGVEVYHSLKSVLKEQGPVDGPRRRGRLRPEPAAATARRST